MKIAVEISPIGKNSDSAHKVRGVGAYINLLVKNLEKFDKKNEYVFVENRNFPQGVDLIHYPYFDPFFETLPNNIPQKFVVTIHDLTPLVFPEHFPSGIKGKLKWFGQRKKLSKADAIITDSECSKRDAIRIAGISEDKVISVYLAADEQFKKLDKESWVSDFRKKYNLPDEFLLYVGDATWNKNLPRLIEAVRNTTYPLIMVGKVWGGSVSEVTRNPWNRDLIKVLKKIESDKQFIRLGFVPTEDLIKIYNLADGLLMPSFYEGFGLPVLEAMSSGCPVICSKSGSLPEVAGDAVYYIEPTDTESIVEGIQSVISSPSLRSELSDKGLAQAKKFSIKNMIENTVKAYESA